MSNCRNKSEIAVLKVELEANKKGFIVSYPRVPMRYDMLLDNGKKIYRVQVKYVNSYYVKNKRQYFLLSMPNSYNLKDIDLLLIYLPKNDVIISIPPERFINKKNVHISTNPHKSKISYMKYIW